MKFEGIISYVFFRESIQTEAPKAKVAPVAPVTPVTPEPPVADGVLFGPDGMPLINDAVVEQDEDGQLHAQIQSHQKVAAWLSVIWFTRVPFKITFGAP